jgi:hypothetical protein
MSRTSQLENVVGNHVYRGDLHSGQERHSGWRDHPSEATESILILLLPFVTEMLQQKRIGRIVATISVCGLLAGEGLWGDMNILLFTIIGVIITLLVIYTQDGLQQEREENPQLQDQLNIQFTDELFICTCLNS